eukprot:TRINITY_DN3314_c0_g1_i11.p1 TRINITY_DN3314_c0_g1~~TRINITY_DN3314_c0_g1_i11.p1  ORF type:complete len:370 (+),score=57.65 TRINITY_DN3314_c0_g1_i11:154-1263(+)
MCNLVSRWFNLSGMANVETIVDETVKNLVIQHFNPKKADLLFSRVQEAPEWLSELIATPKWRQLIYTLSKQYPTCDLLNFTIQLISDAGHQTEIASLTSASIYFSVFNRVLEETLDTIIHTTNQCDLETKLPDFLQMCTHSQHTYLYSQTILHLLMKENLFLSKLSHDLYEQVKHQPLAQQLEKLFMNYSECPDDVFSAMSSIIRAEKVSHGHAHKLFNVYSGNSPPPVKFIRRVEIFDSLIHELFTPGKNIPNDFREYYIFLLAYMSCKDDTSPIMSSEEQKEIQDVIGIITEMQDNCQRNMAGREFQLLSTDLYKSVKHPIVSMSVLYWAHTILHDSSWYLTNCNTKSLDILLDLLNEVPLLPSLPP